MSVDANIYRSAEMAEYVPRLSFNKAEVIEAKMAERRSIVRTWSASTRRPCSTSRSTASSTHSRIATAVSTPSRSTEPFCPDSRWTSAPSRAARTNACHVDVEVSLVPDARTPTAGATAPVVAGLESARNGRVSQRNADGNLSVTIDGRGEARLVSTRPPRRSGTLRRDRTVEAIAAELASRFEGRTKPRSSATAAVTLDSFLRRDCL